MTKQMRMKVAKLRYEVRRLLLADEGHRDTVQKQQKIIDTLRAQLLEARRRTLSFGSGSGEINFLPLAVESFEVLFDTRVIPSSTAGDLLRRVATSHRAKLVVIADMLEQPPTVTKFGSQ